MFMFVDFILIFKFFEFCVYIFVKNNLYFSIKVKFTL